MLRQLRRGVTLSAALGTFIIRRLGVVSDAFGPLSRKFGAAADKHIALLEASFESCLEIGSEANRTTFWRAYEELARMTSRLNTNDQVRVGVELERRAQTVLARQDDFGKLWAREIQEAARLRAAARQAQKEASLTSVRASLSELLTAARRQQSELYAIWKAFTRVVSPNHPAMREALRIAAEDASAVRGILGKRSSSAARLQALRGYMVRVRGALGEGYALLCEAWQVRKAARMADAERLAEELGAGWKALDLTQMEHDILLNGLEGPDALIVLVNRRTGEAIIHTAAQVKTAKVSEAITQSLNDQLRSVGREIRQSLALGTLSFQAGARSEAFTLVARSNVRAEQYVLNAAGGRIPQSDLALLAERGIAATEVVLDISVDQLTQLAITIMEAALKAK